MTNWWEQPYQGGPLVAVPGFPRPLYPPDATSQEASLPGPDVLAYKRTVSRAGRWAPWEPNTWDDKFNNAFSHGRGTGNVGDSGIAGVQRQQGLDATGWVGEKTFNTLRSIRVPEGPHKGEMAMDANAANLIAQAYEMFKPKPPPLPATRERALEAAAGWVGYHESPSGSNLTTFGKWYGIDGQPWCAMFVTYCYEVDAGGSPSFMRGSRWSYVPYIVSDARANRNGLAVTQTPIPGDLVCYDWDYDGDFDHVGIFQDGTPTSFQAVEGNTSSSSNSNGGEVQRRVRSNIDTAIVFVRVKE